MSRMPCIYVDAGIENQVYFRSMYASGDSWPLEKTLGPVGTQGRLVPSQRRWTSAEQVQHLPCT